MLPKPNTQWPPDTEIGSWWDRLDEWEVWFSGDTAQLEDFYSERSYNAQNSKRFWAGIRQEQQRALHLPVAEDIAATSSSLLFAEGVILEPAVAGEGADRLEEIVEENMLNAMLLESAEMCAGLGGVYLKIDTDPRVASVPLVVPIKPAAAVPVFRRGRLIEVTFWRVVKRDDGQWWFLFEERTNPTGVALDIKYRLFKGSEGSVGTEQPLESIQETDALNLKDTSIPLEGLGVVYVPNVRPNRLMPGNPQGMSDYGSLTSLMDALDEAWTSWMRDIRQGLGKLIIDKEFLDDVDTAGFGHFKDTFVQLNLGALRMGAGDKYDPIKSVQFELRTADHQLTCMSLFTEIVDRAGYNPQTFGLDIKGTAQSGTALRIRERKSMMTRQKKSRYWQWGVKELMRQLQLYDIASNMAPTAYEPVELQVELQDSVTPDPKEVSETVMNFRSAQVMSQETAVRLANPDWNDDQVNEELVRLLDEQSQGAMQEVFTEEAGTGSTDEEGEAEG